jgi:para-aminobenzoate synthetase
MNEFGTEVDQVPFDYRGGYIGYLGYEVRHDTQCWIFQQEGGHGCSSIEEDTSNQNRRASGDATNPHVPSAAFLFVDQSLVYDHQTNDWYIIGIADSDDSCGDAGVDNSADTHVEDTISWMHNVESKIRSIGENVMPKDAVRFVHNVDTEPSDVVFVPNRSKAQYQADIMRSHEEIRNGESYELCVTNQLEAELLLPKHPTKGMHESPFNLYKLLREKNPAPFSAFMNFYEETEDGAETAAVASGSLSICCSSPERFLSVKKAQLAAPKKVNGSSSSSTKNIPLKRQFVVESKPIKGTAARYIGPGSNGSDEDPDVEMAKKIDAEIAVKLQESVKDRAENLMIVDLLRNDLGRVCQVGSVHVPKLMHIESYATVHQLVSTIRGTLDGDATNAIDVIEACFPGGSMTGAPKQRTMEIIDEIEQGVSRGPYSGCLGYISLNGCMDMNIVIRSAVLTPSDKSNGKDVEMWKTSIGCGGAITALSNSEDEYDEMLLKSRVIRETVSELVADAKAEHVPQLEQTPDDVTVR